MSGRIFRLLALIVLALAPLSGAGALAQDPRGASSATPATPRRVKVAPRPSGASQLALPQPVQIPPPEILITLVRTTLLSVNDANLTGNYTVLHQRTSPKAQKRTTVQQLAAGFQPIRQQATDMAIIAVANMRFVRRPVVTEQGFLRLNGEFESTPRITFDLFFQLVDDEWRPYAIGVGVVP